jgi:hypothetical protein
MGQPLPNNATDFRTNAVVYDTRELRFHGTEQSTP